MRVVESEWDGEAVLLAKPARHHRPQAAGGAPQAQRTRETARPRGGGARRASDCRMLADAGALLASSLQPGGTPHPVSPACSCRGPADWVPPGDLRSRRRRLAAARCFFAHSDPKRESAPWASWRRCTRSRSASAPSLPHPERAGRGRRRLAAGAAGGVSSASASRPPASSPPSTCRWRWGAATSALSHPRPHRPGRCPPQRPHRPPLLRFRSLPHWGARSLARIALTLESSRLFLEAEEASRMRDEFMAKVSHEMRTPLQAILGWTAILKSALRRRGAAAPRHRGDRAQRQEPGPPDRGHPRRLPHHHRQAVAPARTDRRPARWSAPPLESLLPAAEENDVELVSSTPDSEDLDTADDARFLVFADPHRLQQVITNLTSNAIRHSPRGSEVRVVVEARRGEEEGDQAEADQAEAEEGLAGEEVVLVGRRPGRRHRPGDTAEDLQPLPPGWRRQRGHRRPPPRPGAGHRPPARRDARRAGGGGASGGEGPGATFRVHLPRITEDGRVAPRGGPGSAENRHRRLRSAASSACALAVVDDEADARELLDTADSDLGAEVWVATSAAAFFAGLERAGRPRRAAPRRADLRHRDARPPTATP